MHVTKYRKLIDKVINIVMKKVTALLVGLLSLVWNVTREMGKYITFVIVYNIIE